jgi:tetratricopeptide (TPR) repeat protein
MVKARNMKVDIKNLTSKIKQTKAWKNAENEYSLIYADNMLPPQFRLGRAMTNEEFIEAGQRIIGICPSFYPAYFDMGVRSLSVDTDLAVETLDIAFEIGLKINSWDIISKDYDIFFDNLEKMFHQEFVVRYALKLIGEFPDKAILYDFAASALNFLEEHDKAIEYGMQAVCLEPKNTYFLNNLGLYYLSEKNFEEAEKYLNLSMKADSDHEHPKNNLADCKVMKKNNLSLKEYYLRPADPKKIEEYENNEEWSELDKYVELMNQQKLLIFQMALTGKYRFKAHNLHSLFETLAQFFHFVESVSNETFVWEDMNYLCQYFKQIMHKFIFKHYDVNDEILTEVFDSTLMYYNFLSDNKVIKQKQFAEFKKLSSSLKNEIFDKMHRYNKIRHDPAVSEKKKEKIKEELFEGDHEWMFIN